MSLGVVMLLAAIAICISLPVLDRKLKKREDKNNNVNSSHEKMLKKHFADVNNPKQVVMASRKKSLKNRIKANFDSYFT